MCLQTVPSIVNTEKSMNELNFELFIMDCKQSQWRVNWKTFNFIRWKKVFYAETHWIYSYDALKQLST